MDYKLSIGQKKQYIENDHGMICPFCSSSDLEAHMTNIEDIDSLVIAQPVRCGNCDKQWSDIYTLTDMEEMVGCLYPY